MAHARDRTLHVATDVPASTIDRVQPPGKRVHLLILAVVVFAIFVPALTSRDAWNPDEPRYIEVAREMRVSGDWILPRINGEVYGEKPPLYFWLAAVASMATGESVVAARLVSALACALAIGGTLLLARRMFRDMPGVGIAAGVVLATSSLFFWLGQQGLIDPTLAALTTVATVALLLVEDETRRAARIALTTLAYVAMTAGTLAKGPVGTLVPLVAVAGACAASRGWRAIPWRHFIVAPIIAGAITIGWLYLASLRAGPKGEWYWWRMLGDQTIGRATGERKSHNHLPYWYLGQLAWGAAPWVAFLPAAIASAWPWRRGEGRAGADHAERRLDARARAAALGWAVATFAMFSAISGKRPGYILPMYPALALLVAARFEALASGAETATPLDRWPARWLSAVLIVAGPVLAAAPFVYAPAIAWFFPGAVDVADAIRATLPRGSTVIAPVAGATIGVLGALALRATSAGAWQRVLVLLATAMAVVSLVLHLVAYPAMNRTKSFRAFGEAVAHNVPHEERLILFPHDYDGLVGSYTGALGYEVLANEAGDQALLHAHLAAPGPLWVVAADDGYPPEWLARRFKVVASERVGRRKMFLLRKIAAEE